MATAKFSWDLILLLMALATVVPWRGVVRVRALLRGPELTPSARIALYASTIIAQWTFVAIAAWRCVDRGFSAAGLGIAFPNPTVNVAQGVALALPFALVQIAGFRALSHVPVEQRGRIYGVTRKLMPRTPSEAVIFAVLVATVSLCEEFLYRGFAFAFTQQLFRSSAAALIASSVLFGIGHLYQGRRGILLTFILGLVFGGARIFSASLVPGMIAHFVVDMLAGFVAPGGILQPERGRATVASQN